MGSTREKVEPLKKITLTMTAGKESLALGPTAEAVPMEFVYGIGPNGLTPFEYALADAAIGDTVTLHVKRGEYGHIFGHIQMMLPEWPADEPDLYVRVRVERIEPAGQREVIRAMAEASNCGDTCCGH